MTSTLASTQGTAAFDSTATFDPTTNPSAVKLTGSAANSTDIANIEFYDGNRDLGGTSQFSNTTGWSATINLSPGVHDLTAVVTTLSGSFVTIAAPFELVMGINNEPYAYQERDLNAFGTVVRVSSYDATGGLVSQTSIAGNAAAPSPLSVAFDATATFESSNSAVLTGTTTSYGSASSVEIFDGSAGTVIDPRTGAVLSGAKALGYATVDANGTWSFDAHISPGTHQFTAVAVGLNGVPAAAQSNYEVITGIVGKPYVFQEVDLSTGGRAVATTNYATDGTVVGQNASGGVNLQTGTSAGQVVRSGFNDVMTGVGGSTTFVFTAGFGQDEITNFNCKDAGSSSTGLNPDMLSLPRAEFHSMAQLFRHITTALDGDAVIHLDPRNTIKLDGVTKADLVTHPNVFRFHS